MSKSTLLSILLVTFFTIVALWSLIHTPFYTSHDGFTHTARIAAYYRTIKDFQIPPRWATNLNGALGSPIFTYIYPLPYFLGGVFHAVKFSYQDSFRLVMILSTLSSAIFAFWWLKENFGTKAGIVGAIFYIWVPYRLENLYVRAAYAENLAYTFIPLILLAGQKVFTAKNPKFWWFLLSFSTAALLLSHNLVAAISLPVCLAWTLFWAVSTRKWRMFFVSGFAYLAGILMSSFIYLPDFLERKYILFDKGISYYSDYFVAWWQLIRSHWGYGFDLPGTVNDDMSLQLGLAQILAAVVAAFLIIKSKFKEKAAIFFLGLWLLSIFLMTDEPLIRPIWKMLPLITTIVDFPWRFLGTASLAAAFLAAYITAKRKFSIFLVVIFIAAALIANRNFLRINQSQNFPDPVFDSYKGTSTAASNEYTPADHQTSGFPEHKSVVTVLNGTATININQNNAKGVDFEAQVTEPAVLRINRFYFPDTFIYKDGRKLSPGINYQVISGRTGDAEDDTGLIKISTTPPGGHYQLKFEETPLRKAGDIISLVTFLGLSVWLLKSLLKK